jgi:hypothetical protein
MAIKSYIVKRTAGGGSSMAIKSYIVKRTAGGGRGDGDQSISLCSTTYRVMSAFVLSPSFLSIRDR